MYYTQNEKDVSLWSAKWSSFIHFHYSSQWSIYENIVST